MGWRSLIGQPGFCLLQTNLAESDLDSSFPTAFGRLWEAWLAQARLWVSNKGMLELERDPEVSKPKRAMAGEEECLLLGHMGFSATLSPFLCLCHPCWKDSVSYSCQRD